jgi:hypothetical protein
VPQELLPALAVARRRAVAIAKIMARMRQQRIERKVMARRKNHKGDHIEGAESNALSSVLKENFEDG